jgi:hypothetical protein
MKLFLALMVALCLVDLPADPDRPAVDGFVTREQWGSKPQPIPDDRRQTPTMITLHHAGVVWKPTDDPMQRIIALQSWGQRDKNWPDVPYHFLIAPDGRVFEGRDWHYQPESNTQYDLKGVLNIQLWGDLDKQRASPEQLRAVVELCAWASRRFEIDPATIRGHCDAAPGQTTCPGLDFHRYITGGLIAQWTQELLAGKTPEITELAPLPDGPTVHVGAE